MHITDFHRENFRPTYLYVKQHSGTGKLYFGKTSRANVERYTGSGIHWGRHISAHGKDKVVTLWYCLFTDVDDLVETALMLSKIMGVAESEDWLNFKPETGLDGGSSKGFNGWAGKKHSPEHIEKLKALGRQRPATDRMRENMCKIGSLPRNENQRNASKRNATRMGSMNKGRIYSDEYRQRLSQIQKSRTRGYLYTIQTPEGIETTESLKEWCAGKSINYDSLLSTLKRSKPHQPSGCMLLLKQKLPK